MKNRKIGLAVLGAVVLGLSLFLVWRGMNAVAPRASAPVSQAVLDTLPEPDVPDLAEEIEASPKDEREAGHERDGAESSDDNNRNKPEDDKNRLSTPHEANNGIQEKDVKTFSSLFQRFKAYDKPEALPPGLTFTSTQGRDFKFGDFRGAWLVVNFWASWCPPCVKELPAIEALRKKFQNTNVQIIALSVDPKMDAEGVAAFVAEKSLGDVALYLDSKGSVQESLSLEALPVTLIVNPKGLIVYRIEGDGKWDTGAAERFLNLLSKR